MLDIIIPVYKNKRGLQRTLASINTNYLDRIKVTVIDDKSNEDYSDIKENFPFITLYSLEKNSGPGIARNYGIEHTNEPYIMFIDADDYFINKDIFSTILKKLDDFPDVEIFSWTFLIDIYPDMPQNGMAGIHGYVYKRDFLDKFQIRFSREGSYSNEDVGFNNLCRIIVKHLNLQDDLPHRLLLDTPVMIYTTTDQNSITRSNGGMYLYTKHSMGSAINGIHTILSAIRNNIEHDLILEYVAFMVLIFYWGLCSTEQTRPDYTENVWEGAKVFYKRFLKNYLQENPQDLEFINRYVTKEIITSIKVWPRSKPLNVRRFIEDLNSYEKLPEWYRDRWT